MTKTGQDRLICVGRIGTAHGVRGLVRVRSFTQDPASLFVYAPLTDETGTRVFKLTQTGVAKSDFVVGVDGVADRAGAEALRGTRLYAPRSAFPEPEGASYYEADLIGLEAKGEDGAPNGKVLALHNYGAGCFIEIKPLEGESFMLPFNDPCVPSIDVAAGFLTIRMPEGWLDPASGAEDDEDGEDAP